MVGSRKFRVTFLFFIIYGFIILFFSTNAVTSQIELESGDGIQWRPVLDSNERHPNSSWVTYMRKIEGNNDGNLPIKITLKNFSGGDIPFAWRADRFGIFGKFELFIKSIRQDYYDNLGWENVTGYKVDRSEDVWWELSFPKGGKVWIAFPPRYSGTVKISTPLTPKGPIFGYVGESYSYSTNVISSAGRFNYTFEWGDGSPNGFIDLLPIGANAKANHKWTYAGKYKLQVKASNESCNPQSSDWSNPLNITIYKKENISSNDNLREKIDDAANFTELVLIDAEYNVNNGIIIKNKNHINITSKGGNAVIKGQSIIDKMIESYNSDYVIIKDLNFDNLESGIRLDNSNNCIIENNFIKFTRSGYGIKICSGNSNLVNNNHIEFENNPSFRSNNVPVGVMIDEGKNFHIIGNEIYVKNSNNQIIGYYVKEINELRDITIVIPDSVKNLGVKYGDCEGVWNSNEDIREVGRCRIPDYNSDQNVWYIR